MSQYISKKKNSVAIFFQAWKYFIEKLRMKVQSSKHFASNSHAQSHGVGGSSRRPCTPTLPKSVEGGRERTKACRAG